MMCVRSRTIAFSRTLLTSSKVSSRNSQTTAVIQIIDQTNTHTTNNSTARSMATGTRGSRGHGWLTNYRAGKGGRHLQGKYFEKRYDDSLQRIAELNDHVFALNKTLGTDLPTEVYFEFWSEPLGWKEPKRVVIELASAALPKTCLNFVKLCGMKQETGEHDENDDGFNLGYKSTLVHKIEKNVGIMMGDVHFTHGKSGSCHPSVATHPPHGYNFKDEGFILSHGSGIPGIVTMSNSGVDRNDSRFMITTNGLANQLDGYHVAFGRVKPPVGNEMDSEGMVVLNELCGVFTKRGVPAIDITVVDCGIVK